MPLRRCWRATTSWSPSAARCGQSCIRPGACPTRRWSQPPTRTLDLVVALQLLQELVRRLREVEGPVAWNAWLHDGSHPHLELVPRLSVLAGVELGAGIYVNAVAPEEAAAALRAGARAP